MKLWKWQKGRQDSFEYWKFPLWFFTIWKFGFDAYILKYDKRGRLPQHYDKVQAGNHYRMNICLKGSSDFYIGDERIKKRVIVFRPDIQEHSLVVLSPTLKLSLGFAKYK